MWHCWKQSFHWSDYILMLILKCNSIQHNQRHWMFKTDFPPILLSDEEQGLKVCDITNRTESNQHILKTVSGDVFSAFLCGLSVLILSQYLYNLLCNQKEWKISLSTVRHLEFVSFCRSKTAALTDSRIRLMNEVVSGIRIIKMYAWEKPFSALVTEVRR